MSPHEMHVPTLARVIEVVTGEPLPEGIEARKALYGLGLCGECLRQSTLLADDYICVHCRYDALHPELDALHLG